MGHSFQWKAVFPSKERIFNVKKKKGFGVNALSDLPNLTNYRHPLDCGPNNPSSGGDLNSADKEMLSVRLAPEQFLPGKLFWDIFFFVFVFPFLCHFLLPYIFSQNSALFKPSMNLQTSSHKPPFLLGNFIELQRYTFTLTSGQEIVKTVEDVDYAALPFLVPKRKREGKNGRAHERENSRKKCDLSRHARPSKNKGCWARSGEYMP